MMLISAERMGILVVVLILTACGNSPAEQRASDQDRCLQYGFAPGTDGFARCMMSSDMRREDQNAAALRATNRRIDEQNAQTSADFRARMTTPPATSSAPNRDPFSVPGGLQLPAE